MNETWLCTKCDRKHSMCVCDNVDMQQLTWTDDVHDLTTQILSLIMKCAFYFFINHFTIINNVVSTIFSAAKICKTISK